MIRHRDEIMKSLIGQLVTECWPVARARACQWPRNHQTVLAWVFVTQQQTSMSLYGTVHVVLNTRTHVRTTSRTLMPGCSFIITFFNFTDSFSTPTFCLYLFFVTKQKSKFTIFSFWKAFWKYNFFLLI